MLLHVRIITTGMGHTLETARRDEANKILLKNRVIEAQVDPSVDASPDTQPKLTFCNRQVVFDRGRVEDFRGRLPEGATVCAVCRSNSSAINPYEATYIRDEQTAPTGG
jgi:hypothetical protein